MRIALLLGVCLFSVSVQLNAEVDFFELESRKHPYPAILTKNSRAQLFDSVHAIISHYRISYVQQKALIKMSGREIHINAALPKTFISHDQTISMSGFWASYAVVREAGRKIGLTSQSADQLAVMILKAIMEDLNIDEIIYEQTIITSLAALNWQILNALLPSKIVEACEEVGSKALVSREFDIPYLAGYSRMSPNIIYIDHALPDPMRLPTGQEISTIPFLIVHESFEKALIDFLKLTHKSYLRTHQFAQRLEKACVQAAGFNWILYDHMLDPEIDRADKESRILHKVPRDLDLTPYRDYQDWKLIQKMKKVMVE